MAKNAEDRTYPLIPKSNRHLKAGDYWAIPLSNGKFACGRVLQIPPRDIPYGKNTYVFIGLLDWCSEQRPTFDTISNVKILEQGRAHFKTILKHGGHILGNRPLELDRIEITLETNAAGPPCSVVSGFIQLRNAVPSDFKKYENASTWGFDVVLILAEKFFVKAAKRGV